ncbi:MAG: hypothetical protein KGO02_14495 [Alphaproteobacteria bacterium]|nr:hypothetical protein [Alphaproteobacteria bacterium]
MRNTTSIKGENIGLGWIEKVVSVFLAALIIIPFFAEWLLWSHRQLLP